MDARSQTITYLDNNATTPVDPVVFEAMLPWLRDEYGNPSSIYGLGRRAAEAVETARAHVAGLIGAQAGEILFTSCGTESINTAIQSAIALDPDRRHVVTTAVEHSATMKLCEHLARRGYEITWLPVDAEGGLDLDQLDRSLRDDTALLTLLWANNETGVLFPIDAIAEIAARRKVAVHVDAVRGAGKLPIDVRSLGVQFVSLSGHKMYCPKGVGALYANRRTRFTPLLRGSQEEARRGGTQNVASIVGFGAAAARAARDLTDNAAHTRTLRDHFEKELLARVTGVEVNGDPANRLPNTTNLAFSGIDSEAALMLLDERGVCCSAGSACTSGSVHPSHVLKAMGFSNERARSSLRFSFGRFTTEVDVDRALTVIPEVIHRLRGMTAQGPVVMAA